jgi:hypothetical protein
VTDSRSDDEADRREESDPPAEANKDQVVETPQRQPVAVERRAFLRQLTSEAVTTSGRLAGLSSVVRRSLFAAAESGAAHVAPIDDPTPVVVEAAAEVPAMATAAPSVRAAAPAAAATPVGLSERQDEFLANATIAVLGSNDVARAPHLTASRFHWDGTLVRVPSDLFAARVARVEADPRVSLLVMDADPEAWVAIEGMAAVASGEAVEGGMMLILRKYMADEAADRAWTELLMSENPVVMEIRPSRYLWRFR